MNTTTLTRRKIVKTLAISRKLLEDAEVEFVDDWMAEQVRVGIHGFLWAEHVGETRVEWPANAWEHLKKHVGLPHRRDSQLIAFRAYYPEYRHNAKLGPISLRVEPDLDSLRCLSLRVD